MKTKTVTLYTDLWPGWQLDTSNLVFATQKPSYDVQPPAKRVAIVVDLPEVEWNTDYKTSGFVSEA